MPDETMEEKRKFKCVEPYLLDDESVLTVGKVYEGTLRNGDSVACIDRTDRGETGIYFSVKYFEEVPAPLPLPPAKGSEWVPKVGERVLCVCEICKARCSEGRAGKLVSINGSFVEIDFDGALVIDFGKLEYLRPAHPEPQKEGESVSVQERGLVESTTDSPSKVGELLAGHPSPAKWSPHPHAKDAPCVKCGEVKHRNAAGCCLSCFELPADPNSREEQLKRMGQSENGMKVAAAYGLEKEYAPIYRAFVQEKPK